MSINFAQFPLPRLPLQGNDLVVGYQLIGSVPTLAQYTLTQMFVGVFPGGVVPVSLGGTGLSTVPAGDLLVGTGTDTMNFIIPGAAGAMLISQGTSVSPQFGNNPIITGGSVDGAPVGATTPGSGSFTALAASGAVTGTGFVARFSSPGPIGNTVASTGAFTTVTATGTITPSQTAGIVGTTTNNNANAGSVGELLTNTTTGTPVVSSIGVNATSVALTAGDWDVSGVIRIAPAATTVVSGYTVGPSPISVIGSGFPTITQLFNVAPAGFTQNVPSPVTRISIAATTTIFLIANLSFTGGTCTVDGFIRARRVR